MRRPLLISIFLFSILVSFYAGKLIEKNGYHILNCEINDDMILRSASHLHDFLKIRSYGIREHLDDVVLYSGYGVMGELQVIDLYIDIFKKPEYSSILKWVCSSMDKLNAQNQEWVWEGYDEFIKPERILKACQRKP